MSARTGILVATILVAGCGKGIYSSDQTGSTSDGQVNPSTPNGGPTVSFLSTVSGASGLPDPCRTLHAASGPQITAHPDDPQRLSAMYFENGTLAVVGASSRDGGRTWTRAPITDATICSGGPSERIETFNPSFAGGPNGTAYFGESWANHSMTAVSDIAGVVVQSAIDAGTSWAAGTVPEQANAQNISVVADPDDPNRVFAIWTDFLLVPVIGAPVATYLRSAVSNDGARTFSAPVLATPPLPPSGFLPVDHRMRRNSDGSLLAVYETLQPANYLTAAQGTTRFDWDVHAIRSTDGLNWSSPVTAGASVYLPLFDPDGRTTAGSHASIVNSAKFEIATGPNLMAISIWADQEPSTGRGFVNMVVSHDGGASWTSPFVTLTRDKALFMPAVAIDNDGRIGMFWYDWTTDQLGDAPLSTDAWFAVSDDEGGSWKVTHLAGPFDLRATYDPAGSYDNGSLGQYQGVVAMQDGFGASFTVGPPVTTDKTEVWFAKVQP